MPLDLALLARLRIEPLDRKRHDRAAFSSGEPRIDTDLKTRAAGLMDVEATRAWVACLDQAFDVVGYYALNAHGIDATQIPEKLRRGLPRDHPVPAIFLSNVGVATAYQAQGVGSLLIAHAFRNAVRAADVVGAAVLVLDALSEQAASFYRRHGFTELPDPRGRMIIGMKQIRAAIAVAG